MIFHKILCPTDFSEPSFQVLRRAMAMAADSQAEISLLNVLPRSQSASDEAAVAQAQRDLQTLIQDYASPHLKVQALVREGDVTSEILHAAKEGAFDLIVMATHGATGWREFALGSVVDEVVRLAPCPALTTGNVARQESAADIDPKVSVATGGDDNGTYQL